MPSDIRYWGEAMTFNHPVWMQQDLASARAALHRLAPSSKMRSSKAHSEREQAYLGAVETLLGEGAKEARDLRYEEAMGSLHARYPDDVDAAAFYALSLIRQRARRTRCCDLHALRGPARGSLAYQPP